MDRVGEVKVASLADAAGLQLIQRCGRERGLARVVAAGDILAQPPDQLGGARRLVLAKHGGGFDEEADDRVVILAGKGFVDPGFQQLEAGGGELALAAVERPHDQ